jgi:hypothetical protein
MNIERLKNYFGMRETIEFSGMGQFLWGRKGGIFNALVIITYLFGVLVTKGIMVGNTMRYIFFFHEISLFFKEINAPDILQDYIFWVLVFFLLSGALSF